VGGVAPLNGVLPGGAPPAPTHPLYQGARFLTAAARVDQAPPDAGWEVAFVGRSNAGKSSAINTLCHQKALARTSRTPGRTQLLVFFELDDARRLVDLPGYGYAKVSEAIKREWQAELARYLERRASLAGLVVVMDIRHPLKEFDRQMLAWGVARGLPALALLTKADKLGRGAAAGTLVRVEREVRALGGEVWCETFSAQERVGVGAVQARLDLWLRAGADTTAA
jgi:GTP-binding protein